MKAGVLKPAHAVVLRGLEIANTAHARPVTIVEILEALTPEEVAVVEGAFGFALPAAVGSVLQLMVVRGLVFSPGKLGLQRYFGATSVLDRETTDLPDIHPLRYQVLELMHGAVRHLGRAVRVSDIMRYAATQDCVTQFTRTQMVTAIGYFLKTGEVVIAKKLRGGGKEGRHLYLPADFGDELIDNHAPLNWFETVAAAFDEVWRERLHEAETRGRRPRPVTTRDVRAQLAASYSEMLQQQNEAAVINALLELSKHSQPLIRSISKRARKALFWSPVHIPDSALDLDNSYASDFARIGEACLRAVARHGRPVLLSEIAAEVKADSALELVSRRSLSQVVTGCVDYLDADGINKAGKYTKQHLQSVGQVGNKAFYYHASDDARETAAACAYVELRRLEVEWNELRADAHLDAVDVCSLPTVAVGRAMLIAVDAATFADKIDDLIGGRLLAEAWHEQAERLKSRIDDVVARADEWLASRTAVQRIYSLPDAVDATVATITKEELVRLLDPFYPRAQRVQRSYEITTLLGGRIRRVWHEGAGRRAQVYDRVDAMLYAGRHWGGSECRIQADAATFELGLLRDARFVLSMLEDHDFNTRMTAVACLAFLPSPEVAAALCRVADGDADLGVRQAAAWACRWASNNFSGFAE